MRRLAAVLVTVAIAVFSAATPTSQGTDGNRERREARDARRARLALAQAKYVPGEVLVKFRRGATRAMRDSAHRRARGARASRGFWFARDLEVARLPADVEVREGVAFYNQLTEVEYAEPNYLVRPSAPPNDPEFDLQWHLLNAARPGADINATAAWDLTMGSDEVVVAILDTGVDYDHPDLEDNIFRNAVECDGDLVDDDANSWVDDCHGIDTAYNDVDPRDDFNHGTHVAGIIGAVANNGIGVAGVSPRVRLLPCKFIDGSGFGAVSNAIKCLEYVKALKDRGVNIVATNNSWGGGPFSQALHDAIEDQLESGILFIAAAGNGASDNGVTPTYPASYYLPNVISVAATTRTDSVAAFSNFGQQAVHLSAPGVEIRSTSKGGGYVDFTGTSVAAPQVTGVAALLAAQGPNRDWRAIRNLLLAGGDLLEGTQPTVTNRRLDAYRSLTCSQSTVRSRLQPAGSTTTIPVGATLILAAIHIDCERPNGAVQVGTSSPGGPVTLLDNGLDADQVADDGIYSATWTPPGAGIHTLTFPDGDEVSVTTLFDYEFQSISPQYRTFAGESLSLTDDSAFEIASPFPIHFGGHSFGSLFVGSNGIISFSAPYVAYHNLSIPTHAIPTLVAPFWDDLYVEPDGKNVYWTVSGSTPNRELVVEWRDVDHLLCVGASVRFQVVFFEGSTNILFNYADTAFGHGCASLDHGESASVGVQTGTARGVQVSKDTASLHDGMSLLWTVKTPVIFVSPDSIEFGSAQTKQTKTFTIRNGGGRGFSGHAYVSDPDAPSAPIPYAIVGGNSFTLPPGAEHQLEVEFDPARVGAREAAVSVQTGRRDIVRWVTGPSQHLPNKPTNLRATTPAPNTVVLSWTYEPSTQNRFEIFVGGLRIDPAPCNQRRVVCPPIGPADRSVTVTNIPDAGWSYHWYLHACNATGCSAGFGPVGATPNGQDRPPAVPGTFTVISPAPGQIRLEFPGTGNETAYDYSQDDNVTTLPFGIRETTLNGVNPGVLYRWDVRACNAAGCSAWHGKVPKMADGSDGPGRAPRDGTIVFTSTRDGNEETYVMNADGTGARNLTQHSADDSDPAWSPDGTRIVFSSKRTGKGDIYVMNAEGGGVTNLTVEPPGAEPTVDTSPDWLPDGRIVFSSARSGNFELYVMNGDGGGVTPITNTPSTEFGASVSPDGQRIAFVSDRDRSHGDWSIYVMNSDGTGVRELLPNTSDDYDPMWSTDGKKIVFWSGTGNAHDIWVINADGSDARNLTGGAGADDAHPSFSPDGASIVFSSNGKSASNPDGVYAFCFMPASGSPVQCLPPPLRGSDYSLRWGPALQPTTIPPSKPSNLQPRSHRAGTVDVCWTDTSGNETEFQIASADSLEVVKKVAANLSCTSLDGLDPGWSYHWYVRACNGAGCSDWLGPEGRTPWGRDMDPVIVTQPLSQVVAPGERATLTVAASGPAPFTYQWYEGSRRNTDKPVGTGSSFTTQPLTSTKQYWVRVSNGHPPDADSITATVTVGTGPVIEGDRIAFTSNRDGQDNLEIYVMNADGTGQTNMTTSPGTDRDPTWSPDGSTLAFTSARNGEEQIYLMSADGSNLRRCRQSSVRSALPAWSPDGSRIAFTRWGNADPTDTDIFVMNAADCGLSVPPAARPLAAGHPDREEEPAWSPDGKRIAYVRSTDFNDHQLFTMNIDGTQKAPLQPSILPINAISPDWTPDGKHIVFTGVVPGQPYHIYRVNSDGSGGLTPLTGGADGFTTAISPDGSTIAFSTGREGNELKIYLMNADGTNPRNISGSHQARDTAPDWQLRSPVPAITSQPHSQTIAAGNAVTLTVAVSGSGPLSYQWYVGPSGAVTNPVPDAATNALVTPPLMSTTQYWVRVSNAVGAVHSATATVTVVAPPAIVSQPQSQTIEFGQTATLCVLAAGAAPISYQWYGGGAGDTSSPAAGATSPCHTPQAPVFITGPTAPVTHDHWVRVTNAVGSAASDTASVTYTELTPPVITVASPIEPIYERGSTVIADYSCSGGATCESSVAIGTPIPTSITGYWSFRIKAQSGFGHVTTQTVSYAVSSGICLAPFNGVTAWLSGDGHTRDWVSGREAAWTGLGAYAAGKVAQAFSTGAAGYASLPGIERTGPFTLQAWVRASDPWLPEFTGILSAGTAAQKADSLQIELDGAGNFRLNAGNGELSWLIGPAADYFQNLAVTFDGATVAVFLNGQLVQKDVWPGASRFGIHGLTIGRDRDLALPFTGMVDEIQVFDRALQAHEIEETFFAGASGLCKNRPPVPRASASPNPAEATGPDGATVVLDGTASTDPDGDPLLYTWREGDVTQGSGKTFAAKLPLGAHQITLMVNDGTMEASADLPPVLVHDTTPPSLTVPDGIVAEAAGPEGTVVNFAASATDIVSGAVPVSCTFRSGERFPIGDTVVRCAATDAEELMTIREFVVTVVDTTAPAVRVLSPTPDLTLSGASADVTVQADDAIGVTAVTVNGIAAARTGGTALAGTWRATVPISLPVAPGGALRFDVLALDGRGNPGAAAGVVDNDRIPSALDRSRGGGIDLSAVYSHDFNNGVSAGTVTRGGWTMTIGPAPAPGGVRATISGTGTVATIAACIGAQKEVRLDRAGETADITCDLVTGTITVRAVSARPMIEVWKRQANNTWTAAQLPTGAVYSVGSPATADARNAAPIPVNVVQFDDAGVAAVVGSFTLVPGASVDVTVTPGTGREMDRVRFHVLRGRVPITMNGVRRTMRNGDAATVPIDVSPLRQR